MSAPLYLVVATITGTGEEWAVRSAFGIPPLVGDRLVYGDLELEVTGRRLNAGITGTPELEVVTAGYSIDQARELLAAMRFQRRPD